MIFTNKWKYLAICRQGHLKRKHRVAEADSMFSGGEKTICGIDNPLKKTLTEGLSIMNEAQA